VAPEGSKASVATRAAPDDREDGTFVAAVDEQADEQIDELAGEEAGEETALT